MIGFRVCMVGMICMAVLMGVGLPGCGSAAPTGDPRCQAGAPCTTMDMWQDAWPYFKQHIWSARDNRLGLMGGNLDDYKTELFENWYYTGSKN